MTEPACFHLSIPALDLGGHQLVAQQVPAEAVHPQSGIYPRHFGLVFGALPRWQALRERVEAAGEPFAVAPKCRYPGTVLEHWTFFLRDPTGNWLEFKHYREPEAVLGCSDQASVGDPELRDSPAGGGAQSP